MSEHISEGNVETLMELTEKQTAALKSVAHTPGPMLGYKFADIKVLENAGFVKWTGESAHGSLEVMKITEAGMHHLFSTDKFNQFVTSIIVASASPNSFGNTHHLVASEIRRLLQSQREACEEALRSAIASSYYTDHLSTAILEAKVEDA